MASRPQGYGMTAELSQKKAGKYDTQLDQQARDWIAKVTGRPGTKAGDMQSFGNDFKDGAALCALINKIAPGSVKKVNESKMAFKQMENIGNFLSAAETVGVSKTDLFQTVDLYESQNIPQVINSLHALSRGAGKKGFKPTI